MDKNTIVRSKKKIDVTILNGEKVILDFATGNYYVIKGVGNIILDMLESEISVNEIIERLLTEYDVSRSECEQSVIEFLEKLEEAEFI
ncbi:MAG: PqqD family protein [Lachnospiraceae bacterium]|nr:PqqD family protein [Lachnospiraceae bacterium]MBR5177785.1 PqqD family protein [Lachnospiraceae bacterium]